AESTVFEHAFASSPDDAPSIASLMTGRYPPEHGLLLTRRVRDAVQTLAESLKKAGYDTHAITSEVQMSAASGLQQGFDQVDIVDPSTVDDLDGGAAEMSRRAIAWIRGSWPRKNPFFLTLVYSSPSLPYHPPDSARFRFIDPIVPHDRVDVVADYWLPFAARYSARAAEISDREMVMLRDLYDAEIYYADDRIGEVVSSLREMKLLDSTLLVETASRGEMLGEDHLLADTSSLRDANLRVPLLMRFPGHVKGGLRVAGLAQDVDVMPTMLDLLGVARPETVSRSATSLAPLDGPARRSTAVSTAVRPGPASKFDLIVSGRDDRYRIIVSSAGVEALFDFQADPDGAQNLLRTSPDAAERMLKKLGDWDAALSAVPGMPALPAPGQPPPGIAPGGPPPAGSAGPPAPKPPRSKP
ncbi:MAG TPA: sulfatase, partial [Verrucomicrobiae bacterium]|nr:sulfatase [Verrucomicrobiae bacterium]